MNFERFSKRIRVMVTDDHAIVRHGLCELLQKEGDFVVVGEGGWSGAGSMGPEWEARLPLGAIRIAVAALLIVAAVVTGLDARGIWV